MEHEAIQALQGLNERWPGFFDLVRTQNGYEVEDFTYEDMMRVNTLMLQDEDGMEILVRSMMQLMQASQLDPKVAQWFEDNGFIQQSVVALKQSLKTAEERLNDPNISEEERVELTSELLEAKKQADTVRQRTASSMGKGLMGLRTLLGDS